MLSIKAQEELKDSCRRICWEFFTSSVLTSKNKIKEDVGWSPKYSSYKEGIKQIVSEWRPEGGLCDLNLSCAPGAQKGL